MKLKLLFSIAFICTLLTTSHAQINKGAVWIGSNFSYSQNKVKPELQIADADTRTVSILPSFGVSIKDNLVLGIFGIYSTAHREQNSGTSYMKIEDKTYGGGLLVRRYIPVLKRFYLYGEGRLGYSKSKSDEYFSTPYASSISKLKSWETGLTFTPGIAYGITRNILLEAGVAALFNAKYRNTETNYNTNYLYSAKAFSAGVNLENAAAFTIGVHFLINKKA